MLIVNQLVGFWAVTDEEAAAVTSIVQQANAVSVLTTITAPADIIEGDMLVLLDSAGNVLAAAPSTVVPSGFTSIVNTTGSDGGVTNYRQIASYKLADGSEASSSLTGMASNAGIVRKVLLVFRPDVPASTLTPADPDGQATTGNPTSQTVTASGGTPPLGVFGCYGSDGTAISPRTMSPAKDGEVNSTTGCYFAWKIYNTSPAAVSVDMDDEGSMNILQSFYVQVS
jgi:hypothetical protein